MLVFAIAMLYQENIATHSLGFIFPLKCVLCTRGGKVEVSLCVEHSFVKYLQPIKQL